MMGWIRCGYRATIQMRASLHITARERGLYHSNEKRVPIAVALSGVAMDGIFGLPVGEAPSCYIIMVPYGIQHQL